MALTFNIFYRIGKYIAIIGGLGLFATVLLFERTVVEPVAAIETLKTSRGIAYRAQGMDWFINQTDTTKNCMYLKINMNAYKTTKSYFMDVCK